MISRLLCEDWIGIHWKESNRYMGGFPFRFFFSRDNSYDPHMLINMKNIIHSRHLTKNKANPFCMFSVSMQNTLSNGQRTNEAKAPVYALMARLSKNIQWA